MRLRTLAGSLAWFAVLLGIWELTARSGLVSDLILPPASRVFAALFSEFSGGRLAVSVGVSLGFVFSGIAAGSVLAFLISSLSFRYAPLERLFGMLSAVMHPLPGIALLPVFILFFGIGRLTLLVVIIHSVLWPLVINISAGFSSVPAVYRKIGANYALPPGHSSSGS